MPQNDENALRHGVEQYLWRALHTVRGRVLGTVVDVLGDAESGTPQWLVVRVRGLLRKDRAAPISLCIESRGQLVMPTSRRALREGPRVRPGTNLTARDELRLRVHWFGE